MSTYELASRPPTYVHHARAKEAPARPPSLPPDSIRAAQLDRVAAQGQAQNAQPVRVSVESSRSGEQTRASTLVSQARAQALTEMAPDAAPLIVASLSQDPPGLVPPALQGYVNQTYGHQHQHATQPPSVAQPGSWNAGHLTAPPYQQQPHPHTQAMPYGMGQAVPGPVTQPPMGMYAAPGTVTTHPFGWSQTPFPWTPAQPMAQP